VSVWGCLMVRSHTHALQDREFVADSDSSEKIYDLRNTQSGLMMLAALAFLAVARLPYVNRLYKTSASALLEFDEVRPPPHTHLALFHVPSPLFCPLPAPVSGSYSTAKSRLCGGGLTVCAGLRKISSRTPGCGACFRPGGRTRTSTSSFGSVGHVGLERLRACGRERIGRVYLGVVLGVCVLELGVALGRWVGDREACHLRARQRWCPTPLFPAVPPAGKDAAWNHLWGPVWWAFTVPTFVLSLDFCYVSSFYASAVVDHFHYVCLGCLGWLVVRSWNLARPMAGPQGCRVGDSHHRAFMFGPLPSPPPPCV
jgi:hypothetical protein